MSRIIIANSESVELKDGKIIKEFKGYTMEELRYQRSLAALRKEFCKSNLLQSIANLKDPIGVKRQQPKLLDRVVAKVPGARTTGNVAKIVSKSLLSKLKPMDYVMLGISLIGPAKKVIKSFRKKK